ncbi:MAG: hypothetical protein NVSMB56_05350 [Pyrinomonadaceae bacterium]
MIASIFTILLVLTPCQASSQIPDAQKKEFISLLKTLPHKGEFYTYKAVKKADPYLPILFALTEKDIEKYDIYPFAAISRGLCDQKKHRDYAVHHFAEIRHPTLKLFWGAMLFNKGAISPEIVRFLKDALGSKEQVKLLSEITGLEFEDFKHRVMTYPASK